MAISREIELRHQAFANVTVPPQDAAKMNLLGVNWAVVQDFRRLTQRVPIDLEAAAAYRKPPFSNVALSDPTWHAKDICEQLIKPITRRECSYSELVAELSGSDDHTLGRAAPANVFVSHAWDYGFEQVCGALETFFGSEHARRKGLTRENTFFWFDVFTVRQRNWEDDRADPRPENWWMDLFMVAIKTSGHMVMLAAPWQNPASLTRSWRLFELYACIRHGVDFDLLVSDDERLSFAHAVLEDPTVIHDKLARVDVSKSEAVGEADRMKILSLVEQELGGAGAVNKRVFGLLRQWFQRTIHSEVAKIISDEIEDCNRLHNFALVLNELALYADALKLLHRALAGREKNHGHDHPDTLQTVTNLADVHQSFGDEAEALKLYERCLVGMNKQYGSDHPHTLQTVIKLASLRNTMGHTDEALKLYQWALPAMEKTQRPDHPAVLTTVSNMANVYRTMGNYGAALKLCMKAFAGRAKNFGPSHEKTLKSLVDVAMVCEEMGDLDQAMKFYQQLIESLDTLGADSSPFMQKIIRLTPHLGNSNETTTVPPTATNSDEDTGSEDDLAVTLALSMPTAATPTAPTTEKNSSSNPVTPVAAVKVTTSQQLPERLRSEVTYIQLTHARGQSLNFVIFVNVVFC